MITIVETGGIRMLRRAREGRGKSGGARVIYHFHNGRMPLYLLTIYGKGDKDNLTQGEKQELHHLIGYLKEA